MPNTVYSSIVAFSKAALTQSYIKCRTAVLNNPENKIYTPLADTTRIRQVVAGAAGDYTGAYENVGSQSSVEYKDYKATCDRFKQLIGDVLEHDSSFITGAKPSLAALVEDFINRQMAGEIDAYAIAKLFGQAPTTNVFDTSTLKVDDVSIFGTLLELQKLAFDAGVDDDVELFTFVNNTVYNSMQKAILDKNGLANSAILTNRKSVIDLGVPGIAEPVEVNTQVIKFNNMSIIRMPDSRMNSKITLYDGKTSGQTDGGWAPAGDSVNVPILVVPSDAAFTDTRYQVLNYLLPAGACATPNLDLSLDKGINNVLGDVVVENIGINQKANNYECDLRVVYNAEAFDIKKSTLFAIKNAAA